MAFEGGDRFKVLTMKLPLCMALILSMTLKYDDFSKQIRNELRDPLDVRVRISSLMA